MEDLYLFLNFEYFTIPLIKYMFEKKYKLDLFIEKARNPSIGIHIYCPRPITVLNTMRDYEKYNIDHCDFEFLKEYHWKELSYLNETKNVKFFGLDIMEDQYLCLSKTGAIFIDIDNGSVNGKGKISYSEILQGFDGNWSDQDIQKFRDMMQENPEYNLTGNLTKSASKQR